MSCGSGLYDICLQAGTSFSLPISFDDGEGNIIDISSWSGQAPITHRYGDSGLLNYFLLDFAGGATGLLVMSMDETGTAALPVSQHRYQLNLYPNSTSKVRYLWGYVDMSPGF